MTFDVTSGQLSEDVERQSARVRGLATAFRVGVVLCMIATFIVGHLASGPKRPE
jgi:hypothetical protein